MTSVPIEKGKTFCDWATAPFTEFLNHQEDLNRVLTLSAKGIAMLRGRAKALEVLYSVKLRSDVEEITPEDHEKNMARARREAELAQTEVENDFPLLHEQATVALWGSLEALIKTFVACWLTNKTDAWQIEAVKKLKVRLGDYLALDPSDRIVWIVDMLDQEVSGPLRNGVQRFESLLQLFGLDGTIDDSSRKSLFELSQIRHVIVHRRSRADKRLIEACPWLSLAPGQRIRVSHKSWQVYNDAAGTYILELIQRIRCALGHGRYTPEEPPNLEGCVRPERSGAVNTTVVEQARGEPGTKAQAPKN